MVIELKLKQGHERVIAQALLYRAKVERFSGVPKVRRMLVAAGISDDLRTATTEVSDIQLFEYQLAMQVKSVSTLSDATDEEK